MWHLLHEERFRYVYRSLRSCSILALIAQKKKKFQFSRNNIFTVNHNRQKRSNFPQILCPLNCR